MKKAPAARAPRPKKDPVIKLLNVKPVQRDDLLDSSRSEDGKSSIFENNSEVELEMGAGAEMNFDLRATSKTSAEIWEAQGVQPTEITQKYRSIYQDFTVFTVHACSRNNHYGHAIIPYTKAMHAAVPVAPSGDDLQLPKIRDVLDPE